MHVAKPIDLIDCDSLSLRVLPDNFLLGLHIRVVSLVRTVGVVAFVMYRIVCKSARLARLHPLESVRLAIPRACSFCDMF